MIVATCYATEAEAASHKLDLTFNLPYTVTWLFQLSTAEELITELACTLVCKIYDQPLHDASVRVVDDRASQWRVVLVRRAPDSYQLAVCDLMQPVSRAIAMLDAIHFAHAPPLEALQTVYDPTPTSNHKARVGTVLKTLDETKAVLHQTIDQVLARGEKLDDLVHKSARLSETSKMFYTQAQKHNSFCHRYCTLM